MQNSMNNKDVDTIVSAFVEYLKKQNKLNLMPSIVKQMQSLVKGDLQKGHIISAIPMDEKNIREIENKLSLKFASTIELVNTVDPSIIGGIIIKFGDVVIDESVRTRLHTLEQTIYGS
jgi:F-type H+-transporting ATPase subunit delta